MQSRKSLSPSIKGYETYYLSGCQDTPTLTLPSSSSTPTDVEEYEEDEYVVSSQSKTNTGISEAQLPQWMEDEYILEDQTPTTQENCRPVQATITNRRPKVVSLYDEDNYALADVRNCATREAGILRQEVDGENSNPPPTKSILIATKSRKVICGVILVVLFLAGVGGVVVVTYEGNLNHWLL